MRFGWCFHNGTPNGPAYHALLANKHVLPCEHAQMILRILPYADSARDDAGILKHLVKQGGFLLKLHLAEFAKDPLSRATESSRSNLMAVQHTVEQVYGSGVAIDDLIKPTRLQQRGTIKAIMGSVKSTSNSGGGAGRETGREQAHLTTNEADCRGPIPSRDWAFRKCSGLSSATTPRLRSTRISMCSV
jgi:hypothetical protein